MAKQALKTCSISHIVHTFLINVINSIQSCFQTKCPNMCLSPTVCRYKSSPGWPGCCRGTWWDHHPCVGWRGENSPLYQHDLQPSTCYLTEHYDDVTMTTLASQITSLTVVYSIVYSGVNQRKHQSSASLAFVWGIHRDRWIPRTKGQ